MAASVAGPPVFDLGQKTIRAQLALLVLGIVLPAFAVAVVYLTGQRNEARNVAREKVAILATNAAQRLAARLREHELLLTHIANQPSVRAMDPARCDLTIRDFVRLNPEYVGMGTRDMQGNLVCTDRKEAPARRQMLSYPWFTRSLGGAGFGVSDAFLLPIARRWTTMLTMPVRDDAGRQVGVVVLPVDLLKLNQSVLEGVPAKTLVTVIGGDFNMLLRSADPERWIGQPATAVVEATLRAQREGFMDAPGADGIARLVAFRPLDGTPWRVAAGVPVDDVFGPADTALRNGILACVVLLLVALGVAWRLARSMVRPLDALVATAGRVAGGDVMARVPPLTGAPEFVSVARGFNQMLDALAAAEARNRRSQERLAITLDSIGDGVIATDNSGVIRRMNAAAQRLTGWSFADARGRLLAEVFRVVDADTREPVADPVQAVTSGGETVTLSDGALLLARDGREYRVSDSASPIRDHQRQVHGVVLVFSDTTRQHAVQRALVEAYNFSRQILLGLPLGLNVRGLDRRYREWNPAMAQITGMGAEQVNGRPMEEAYPDQPAAVRDAINAAITRAEQGDIVLRPDTALDMPDGLQWTSTSHSPLRNAAGEIIGTLAIVQDITARKLAEQALRDSEENLSITLLSIGDAVIVTNAAGTITRMNRVAERLTGWSLAQGLGHALPEVFRIVHADTREPSLDPVQRVLEAGEIVGLANHTALLSRDGSEYQISDSAAPIRDADGRIVGVVLVFSDVSEQYRLQRVVVESEQRYRALVESSPVGVVVHLDGVLTYANPMALRIVGAQDPSQVLGRPAIDFVHPDDRARWQQRAHALADDGSIAPMAELRYIRLDGRVVDVQSQGIPVDVQGRRAVQVSVMDISQRKQAERRLRDSEERFRALTGLSSDWYWEQDDQFRFAWLDGNLTAVAGTSYDSLIGKTRWEVPGFRLTPQQWAQHREVLQAHLPFRDFQMRHTDAQGRDMWVAISGAPIVDASGVFRGYRGVGRDITAEKAAADQIHALAFYDALTELPNRRLLIEQLKKALLGHARTHRQAALLFIDLDNFKTLNDTLGHETGDMLLRQVARRLVECVREVDTVARLGGDEFVVMLEDLSEHPEEAALQAEAVGNKILAAFGPAFELGSRSYRSTPSIGVTLFGKTATNVDDLLKHADLAMYQAKGSGRNTLRMFDQRMQAAVDQRVALESELREALALGQMRLLYQPVVDTEGRVIGAEALVRWQHPQRGTVSPCEFIPLAESTRLIIPLGQWVLQTACSQIAAWAAVPHMAHLSLAVNVSANQFKEPDFVDQVLLALRQTGADPRQLKLELTESLLVDSVEDTIAKMARLRLLGIDFSLDDFGTGYSSLSYVKRLPLAQLKIDQSFVRDVLVDPHDAAIARTIVALGDSLGLVVIAEGVETQGQHQLLRSIGCRAFQGYLFGRPMPVAELDRFVRNHGATADAGARATG
jgi:diguanylate cyclase (GGDEF)-like protein/PAS domain S-box-containing protein